MMEIRWTLPARHDFRAHLNYLAERDGTTALALGETVLAAVGRLTEQPYRGRPGRRDGTRELLIGGWPYLVVYAADRTGVVILRILHVPHDGSPQQA